MRHSLALVAVLAITGCASLSKAECLSGDWRVIGYNDGAAGAPPGRIGDHSEACARHGIAPSLSLWQTGYQEGLVAYCTRSNGFSAGVRGAAYHGVCSGPAGDEFVFAYRDGRQVYDVRQALQRANSDLYSLRSEMDDLENDRNWSRQQADLPDTSDEDRRRHLDEVERLSERIGDLRRQERDIEYSIRRIESDVWNVEAQMRSFYPEWNGY